MILQALYEYYERKAADPENQMAPEGFEWKEIPFVIVIDREGRFVRLEQTWEIEGKNRKTNPLLLPRARPRVASKAWQVTNLLWDHYGYVLGLPKGESEELKVMAQKQHRTFLAMIQALPDSVVAEREVQAVRRFYESDELNRVLKDELIEEILKIAGCNLTFRVEGHNTVVPENPAIRRMVEEEFSSNVNEGPENDVVKGLCLITGQHDIICRTHNKTAINKDSDSFVSFQKNSGYDSYGKKQAYNAPVGRKAEFRYANALKTLLARDSLNKMDVGDATVVFWGEKRNGLEKRVKSIFSEPQYEKDDPDRGIRECRDALNWIQTGIPFEEGQSKFFILGLSPGGGSRISVRFWYQDTVAAFARNIAGHFDDLKMVGPTFDNTWFGLKTLLKAIALKEEDDKLAPNLSGEVSKAILVGLPYPETLLQQCIRRIRSEHFDDLRPKKYDKKGRLRAALLKACLNRKLRRSNPKNQKEITVSLDLTNTDPGYRLGRLFAVLEKIQEDANPGLNATIRDRFYGAASSNPVAVFPQLLKLKNHHLSKLESVGFKKSHERRLAEIIDGLGTEMPAHLAMDEQARFAIGYYHQRQALFTKNETNEGEKS